jgi:hypothetical protein
MSDTQTVWMILWKRATSGGTPSEPFEISEVVPEVVKTLQVSNEDATQLITGLLNELARLPEGKQYFALEGSAVVPLPELAQVTKNPKAEFEAYPYEL